MSYLQWSVFWHYNFEFFSIKKRKDFPSLWRAYYNCFHWCWLYDWDYECVIGIHGWNLPTVKVETGFILLGWFKPRNYLVKPLNLPLGYSAQIKDIKQNVVLDLQQWVIWMGLVLECKYSVSLPNGSQWIQNILDLFLTLHEERMRLTFDSYLVFCFQLPPVGFLDSVTGSFLLTVEVRHPLWNLFLPCISIIHVLFPFLCAVGAESMARSAWHPQHS